MLLEVPAAVTVRAYRADWTPTIGLSYAAVLDGPLVPAGESGQPAAWTPLSSDWEGAFPGDRLRIRAYASNLKAARDRRPAERACREPGPQAAPHRTAPELAMPAAPWWHSRRGEPAGGHRHPK